MEQKYVIGIMALALVSVLGVSVVSAHGFGLEIMNHELTDEERADMQVQMDSVHEAIANGNYEAWAELMNEQIARMQEQITEENFNALVDKYDDMEHIHELRDELRTAIEDGDNEAAESIRTELQDLMPGNGMKVGWGMGHEKTHEGMMPFD